MFKILNICLHQNSIFIKFFKILKIHEIFCENPRIIFVLCYDVHKESMFTINLEDEDSKLNFSQKRFCKELNSVIFRIKLKLHTNHNLNNSTLTYPPDGKSTEQYVRTVRTI